MRKEKPKALNQEKQEKNHRRRNFALSIWKKCAIMDLTGGRRARWGPDPGSGPDRLITKEVQE
jgi:hypothetical protein